MASPVRRKILQFCVNFFVLFSQSGIGLLTLQLELLALLGGAFGVSPNPRALGLSSGVERMMGMMGCGSSADSPMMAVFYSPRLVHNDHQ